MADVLKLAPRKEMLASTSMARRRRASRLAGSAVVTLLASVAPAHAEDASIPLRVEYTAPIACPSDELFVAQVRERTPRIRLAAEGEASKVAKVDVALAPSGQYEGRLALAEPEGGASERVVTGESCADVVRAVAFVVSVFAVERSTQAGPEAPAPPPPASRERTVEPDRVSPERRSGWAILASAGVRNGVGETFGPAISAAVERYEEGTWLAPSVRARVQFAQSTMQTDGERLVGRLFTAGVDGCALRLGPVDGAFGVSPCLRFEGGLAHGDIGSSSGGAPWFAPGALARGRLRLVSGLVVELDAGISVPLVHSRFAAYTPPSVRDVKRLAQAPAIAAELAASVGWAFR